MTPEEYYKKRDYPTLDKFDKKAPKFDYYDLVDFAESYHQAKLKLLSIANVSKAKRTACRCGRPYSEKDLQDGMCNKCCAPTTEY